MWPDRLGDTDRPAGAEWSELPPEGGYPRGAAGRTWIGRRDPFVNASEEGKGESDEPEDDEKGDKEQGCRRAQGAEPEQAAPACKGTAAAGLG